MPQAPVDLPMAASVSYVRQRRRIPRAGPERRRARLGSSQPQTREEWLPAGGDGHRARRRRRRTAAADVLRAPARRRRSTSRRWIDARGDRTAFVAMTDVLPLLPGEYDWRIVFRDERSGKMGGTGGRVSLKDFRAPSTASTMLLTRAGQPAAGRGSCRRRRPPAARRRRRALRAAALDGLLQGRDGASALHGVQRDAGRPRRRQAGHAARVAAQRPAGWRRGGRGRAGRGRQACARFSLPAPSARPRWSRERTPLSACCRTSRRARPNRSSSASC